MDEMILFPRFASPDARLAVSIDWRTYNRLDELAIAAGVKYHAEIVSEACAHYLHFLGDRTDQKEWQYINAGGPVETIDGEWLDRKLSLENTDATVVPIDEAVHQAVMSVGALSGETSFSRIFKRIVKLYDVTAEAAWSGRPLQKYSVTAGIEPIKTPALIANARRQHLSKDRRLQRA